MNTLSNFSDPKHIFNQTCLVVILANVLWRDINFLKKFKNITIINVKINQWHVFQSCNIFLYYYYFLYTISSTKFYPKNYLGYV